VLRRFAAVWPDSPGRREAEAAWRSLDDQGPPVPIGPGPSRDLPPDPPDPAPLPPGRSALGSFDPGRRGVRVLAVVAVLVVLVAGYLAWRSQPRAEPVPVASSGSVAPVATGLIVVAVQGRVAHPACTGCPTAPGWPTRWTRRAARCPASTCP